ncbi:uncharacterized protein LOC142607177 isoform X2 [Castanea sativa]|uniref:uncharacterized protein LOC142607177 isoform X2 n=1 Tax=Castanea sativa TaxID=21020 RepID=UPI003F64A71A
MEVWDPPDNINLGMMCSARVTGRCTVQSLLLLGWKDLERLQFLDIFEMEPGSFDHSLPTQQQYHISNDAMEGNVIWTPYDNYLHPWCLVGKHIWLTTALLLCFQIVEYYHPERVMRQFGLLQRCPKWPTDNFDKSVHCVKLTGKAGVD